MTFAKAIAAFLASLVALLATFGLDTGQWITPSLIEAVSAVLGAVATGVITYWIPNKKPEDKPTDTPPAA